jgi:hypothetical protein
MAIVGPEGARPITPVAAPQIEARQFYVATPVAKQLNLHDGQVVQANVSVQQEQVKLNIAGQVFHMPLSPYIKNGDLAQLRAQLLPSGKWVLQLLHSGAFAGPDVAPATQANATQSQATLPSRLNTLLFQPAGLAQVLSLWQPGVMESLVPMSDALGLKQRIQAQRLHMASLQPQTLKRWFMSQTQSGEANLSEGEPVGADPKVLLRLLMHSRELAGLSSVQTTERLNQALDEVEAAQVQTVQDWHRGDVQLSFVLPFKDAHPVQFHIERQASKSGQPSNPWVVHMHTDSPTLGEVWLKTTISQASTPVQTNTSKIDLAMWAMRADVAQQARLRADELTDELESAGLVMGSFQVFNAPRPDGQPQRHVPDHGALVDTQV